MMARSLISSKWIPVDGYSMDSSYCPLRSSVTTQEMASDNRPMPFDVNTVLFSANRIGFIYNIHHLGVMISLVNPVNDIALAPGNSLGNSPLVSVILSFRGVASVSSYAS